MRIVLTVENTTMQFTLTPESEQEKKLLKVLEDYYGEAKVVGESDGNPYYHNNFKRLIVTIYQKSPEG